MRGRVRKSGGERIVLQQCARQSDAWDEMQRRFIGVSEMNGSWVIVSSSIVSSLLVTAAVDDDVDLHIKAKENSTILTQGGHNENMLIS